MSPSEDDVRRQLDRLLASAPVRERRAHEPVSQIRRRENARRRRRAPQGIRHRRRGLRPRHRLRSTRRFDRPRRGCAGCARSSRSTTPAKDAATPSFWACRRAAMPPSSSSTAGRRRRTARRQRTAPRHWRPPPDAAEAAPQPSPFSARRLWALGTVLALAAVAAAATVVAWGPGMAPAPALRIAVLPFTPDASDTDSALLAEHLTEGVTAELVHDGRFGVVASSAARAEYSRERRPRDISSAIEADILVEARITTDGDRVRVEARVMDGPREEKLWVRGFAGTPGRLRMSSSAKSRAPSPTPSALCRVGVSSAARESRGRRLRRELRASPTRSADGSATRARSPSRR